MNDEEYISRVVVVIGYAIAIIIFLLEIAIFLRGLDSLFYKSLNTTTLSSLTGSIVGYVIAYAFALYGFYVLMVEGFTSYTNFLLGITILGLTLSILWDLVFFYINDILLACVVQMAVCVLYTWIMFILFKLSAVAGIFQLPLVLRNYYLFYQNVVLYLNNSSQSNLRSITK